MSEKDFLLVGLFAEEMISKGENPDIANIVAGNYYGYSVSEVEIARKQFKQKLERWKPILIHKEQS